MEMFLQSKLFVGLCSYDEVSLTWRLLNGSAGLEAMTMILSPRVSLNG